MKRSTKSSKRRAVSSKSTTRKRPAAPKKVRKPKAAAAKPKSKVTAAKPKPKPAAAPIAKGPSAASLQRQNRLLQEQLQAHQHDRVELARWQQYHRQLQEQVKAKDAALAFREKELLDLRRQLEELKEAAKKRGASAQG